VWPAFRALRRIPSTGGRVLAGNLLFAASEWTRDELDAQCLVIAADPNYFAIEMYRSLGFAKHDHKVYLSRV
jgi:hypothetical protein